MGSLLLSYFYKIDGKVAIDCMGRAHASNLKPTNRLKGKANTIVEMVIDSLTIIVMIDGMTFVIQVYRTTIRYSSGFVAIAYHRCDVQPRQNGDFVARINRQGRVVLV